MKREPAEGWSEGWGCTGCTTFVLDAGVAGCWAFKRALMPLRAEDMSDTSFWRVVNSSWDTSCDMMGGEDEDNGGEENCSFSRSTEGTVGVSSLEVNCLVAQSRGWSMFFGLARISGCREENENSMSHIRYSCEQRVRGCNEETRECTCEQHVRGWRNLHCSRGEYIYKMKRNKDKRQIRRNKMWRDNAVVSAMTLNNNLVHQTMTKRKKIGARRILCFWVAHLRSLAFPINVFMTSSMHVGTYECEGNICIRLKGVQI